MTVRRAVAGLLVVGILLTGANFLFTAHYVNSTRAQQQQAGEMVERKLCSTLGKLAALKPPAGNPATNPSRAYEDELHATLDGLGPDIGCKH